MLYFKFIYILIDLSLIWIRKYSSRKKLNVINQPSFCFNLTYQVCPISYFSWYDLSTESSTNWYVVLNQ